IKAAEAPDNAAFAVMLAVFDTDRFCEFKETSYMVCKMAGAASLSATEGTVQAHLLHDIIGNPFRPVALASAIRHWNDGTVMKMGQGIYDERAFDRLPILADGLEEAGCTNQDILQ